MLIQEGYFYHIKDEFFSLVNDSALMSNKENGGYRPHYFAVRDSKNQDIFWMVPVSSRYEKYKKFHDSQIEKYHKCTKVVLGKFAGTDCAFLVQNAFPVIADFFDHIHTRFDSPATGITGSKDDLFAILGCMGLALAGLSVLIIRKRKE